MPNKIIQIPGLIARGFEDEAAASVEITKHHNGSGDSTFGGAKNWPAIHVRINFQEDASQETVEEAAKALPNFANTSFRQGPYQNPKGEINEA